jgi:hypothetical protein
MTKQKLTFKVDGGLKKLADFYATAEKEEKAADTYWQKPEALLEALNVAPSKEIRISSGYRKLAASMETIDFEKWHGSFDRTRDDGDLGVQETAFTSLYQTVAGADIDVLQMGRLGDDFGHAMTITMTMTMTMTITITVTMTMTVTITSGYSKEEPQRLPVPGGPKFASAAELGVMARYAQTVADHIGWFA